MKLHQLRDFIAVASTGSVRAAARHLKLSQPTLTRSIHQLEKELGLPLFERTAKGAGLNDYGRTFLARAEHVTNEVERSKDELKQMASGLGATVVIAVSGTPSLQFLPPALQTFKRRFTEGQVRIVEGGYTAVLPGLRTGAIDFAVVPEPNGPPRSEFAIEPIFRDRRVVAGRKGHPLRHVRSLAGLLESGWIVTVGAAPKALEFDAPFLAHGLRVPRADFQCDSLIALLSLVANSDLLVFLPGQWLGSAIIEHVLEEIPVRERIESPTICLVQRQGLPLTPAAEALAEAVRIEAQHRNRLLRPEKGAPGARARRPGKAT